MGPKDKVEEHIQDTKIIFQQRWSEYMDINFWNPGTDREDDAQDGMEAKQVGKIVKSIDAAGAVNKDDAEFMRMTS
jgi:hypothetical protein